MKNPFKRLSPKKTSVADTQRISLEKPQNEYYESISVRFGHAQVVLFVLLFAFVIFFFLTHAELITYRSFDNFFKDLSASAEAVDLFDATSVTYPTNDEQSFALYRNGLAIAGTDSVTIFSATGRQKVSKIIDNYQHPIAVGAGKYLLVYESGGTRYSIYNFHTQIHTGSTEFPIFSAAVSAGGTFALVSSSEAYPSVVFLYNDRFELLSRYDKNAYVMDVAINEKGNKLAMLTSSVREGIYQTELELYKLGENAPLIKKTVAQSIGLSCTFFDSSHVAVLCGDGVYFFKQDGNLSSSHSFGDKSLRCMDVSSSSVALCLTSPNALEKNSILIFDKTGRLIHQATVQEQIKQISLGDDVVYALFDGGIRQISKKDSKKDIVIYTDTEARYLLAINQSTVLLCSPQKAVYWYF